MPGAALLIAPVLAGLLALCAVLFPRRLSYLQEVLIRAPGHTIGAGGAIALLVVGLHLVGVVLLATVTPLGAFWLSLCVLMDCGIAVASLGGMAALATLIGDGLLNRRRALAPPLVCAVVGALVLGAPIAVLLIIPPLAIVGAAALAVWGTLGAGAMIVTRGGTRLRAIGTFVQR